MRADTLDHAGAEVALDALDRGGWHHLQEARPELQTVLSMLLPLPAGLNALAGVHLGGGPQHCHQIPVAADLDAQHAEAGLGAMERDAFNEPRQRLATSVLV